MTRSLAALVAFALIASQSLIVIHDIKHGDEHHEHHGQPCVVYTISDIDDALMAPAIATLAIIVTWRAASVIAQSERDPIAACAFRPRGPPSPVLN